MNVMDIKRSEFARELHRWAAMVGLAFAVLLFDLRPASAENAATVLSLDGQLRPLAVVGLPPLSRQLLAEDQTFATVDEYAVIAANGKLAYATKAFPAMLSSPSVSQTFSVAATLVIEHQRAHDHNERYSPTPTAIFRAQRLSGWRPNVQRGFAVFTIGQTGEILGVKAISARGEIRDYDLYDALANGITTEFPDYRRHDHTVYLAYEVRGGTLRQVGASLVTMPFCQAC